MFANKLKLNPDKTEFIIIGTNKNRDKFSQHFPLNLLNNLTTPADHVRNLGVTFDKNFSFSKHITNIAQSCCYHMRDLRRIRRHLSLKTATALANALVSSRLDYCNSLFYGLSSFELGRLQRIQNIQKFFVV